MLRKKFDNINRYFQYNKQLYYSSLRKNQNKLERLSLSSHFILVRKEPTQWKRISCKQNARWQHLSRSFFSLKKNLVVTKHYNLYLGLLTPSSGWWSPIGAPFTLPGLPGNIRQAGKSFPLKKTLAYFGCSVSDAQKIIKRWHLCSVLQILFSSEACKCS